MALSIDTTKEVKQTLARWAKESAMYFCRLAKNSDCCFENVTYPTGMKTVIARVGTERSEVPLPVAKQLRANGYRVVCG